QASRQSVYEELPGGITALGTSPNSDQEKEWHQRQFEENVEENNIERNEDAQHASLKRQEPGVIFIDTLLDLRRIPGHEHRGAHEKACQHDQPDVHAVDADIKLNGRTARTNVQKVPGRDTRIATGVRARNHLGRESQRSIAPRSGGPRLPSALDVIPRND